MKQFETSKKEYIAKLKRDLDTIELKYSEQINRMEMVTEDHYSQAYMNLHKYVNT